LPIVCVFLFLGNLFYTLHATRLYHERTVRCLEVEKARLEEELKNTRPEITGKILAVHVDANFLMDGKGPDIEQECFLTVHALIESKRADTTIQELKLTLNLDGQEYEARSAPVAEYHIEKELRHPAPWETSVEKVFEPLKDLAERNHILFTKGEHREGWLRFVIVFPW